MGAGGAKAAHQRLEGGEPVAKAGSDLGQRLTVEEVGAEGFVTAMEGRLGLQEELPAKFVVHGVISTRLIVFPAAQLLAGTQRRGHGQEERGTKTRRNPQQSADSEGNRVNDLLRTKCGQRPGDSNN